MLIREITFKEKEKFNRVVTHPLQSWQWGEFKKKTGLKVVRLGAFEKNKLRNGYQLTIHPIPIPKLDLNIIYFPKGPMPEARMLSALQDLGQKQKAIFIKLEPNVSSPLKKEFLASHNCRSGRPLFTPYTLQIDLTQSEKELLANMKEKTRYNLRLAQKRGVKIIEDNSEAAFETYLDLMEKTTQRQGFFAHTLGYHRKMWSVLQPAKMARLFLAKYKGKTLVAWILFVFKDTLYYPYGASSRENQQVMPGYAMMWEAIKFGKKIGCRTFDLWGSLGPNPDPKNPWFGFHRFKLGFGPNLIKFIGTYDLVINPSLYPLVRLAEGLRWKLLRLKTRLAF